MMTIGLQMTMLQGALQEWIQGESGGMAFVANDAVHLWQILMTGPAKPKAIVIYDGEEIRGPFDIAAVCGRVDRIFRVIISRGRGFNQEAGKSLTVGTAGGRPMFELVEKARDIIRTIIFSISEDDAERPSDFKRVRPLEPLMREMLIDAYQIEFSVGSDVGMIADQPQELATPIPEG